MLQKKKLKTKKKDFPSPRDRHIFEVPWFSVKQRIFPGFNRELLRFI